MTHRGAPGRPTAVALPGALLVGVLALAGCTASGETGADPGDLTAADVAQARERWEQGGWQDYSYVLEGTCGEQQLVGRWAARVVDGAVAEVAATTPGGWTPTSDRYGDIPTVPALFDRLDAAVAGDGIVQATFSPHVGYPMALVLDPMPDSVDDETCLTVSAVTPLDP
ncbi:DUF6174 domain-containing protein [Cellulomonas sp. P22]|uniref:DUF6174 domain-containing protein n=1 Tax=Cellulomonas sp. P22 TaxID=3373189 RepID=UPI0037AEF8EC